MCRIIGILNEWCDGCGWEVKNLTVSGKISENQTRFFGRKLPQNDIYYQPGWLQITLKIGETIMQEKPDKIKPALFGGLTIAIISAVPVINFINCFCCAGVILGGLLSVYFYNKSLAELADIELTYADGISLGLMSGAFGAVIGTLFSSLIGTNIQQSISKMMEYSSDLPPEFEEALDMLGQYQEGFTLIALGLIMALIIDCLFGMLGGILAVSIFTKKKVG